MNDYKTIVMYREKIKEAAEVMLAFADGKKIEREHPNGKWQPCDAPLFDWASHNYRIKPEPKYRPFKTQEECWNEMLKHQPFGYLRYMESNKIVQITGMNTASNGELQIDLSINRHMYYTTIGLFEVYTFTDGAPFGVKEE